MGVFPSTPCSARGRFFAGIAVFDAGVQGGGSGDLPEPPPIFPITYCFKNPAASTANISARSALIHSMEGHGSVFPPASWELSPSPRSCPRHWNVRCANAIASTSATIPSSAVSGFTAEAVGLPATSSSWP